MTIAWRKRALELCLLVGWGAMAAPASGAGFWAALSGDEEPTAVNAKEFNGYVRPRLPDGAFKPETFAFGEGGVLPGETRRDPTFDSLCFSDIARVLAGPLARQNYLPAPDSASTNLLIMVYWGTTFGANNTQSGPAQDAYNYWNATLLGFETEARLLGENAGDTARGGIIRQLHAGGISAIQVDRYYVILRAFDFQAARKQKKLKLLWETRFSLSERHHGFKQDLPAMAEGAAQYFGRDTYGLVRIPPVREGHILLGQPKVLGVVDDDTDRTETESAATAASLAGDWLDTTPGRLPVIVHIDQSGNATFENPSQRAILPARVAVNGDSVTVSVPGWDISFRGTHNGDHISGTISEYGTAGHLNLVKTPKPAGEEPSDRDRANPHGDAPRKSSPEPAAPSARS